MRTTRYDAQANTLAIETLTTSDPRVLAECRHWATGHRGDPVDTAELSRSDLSAFAEQALAVGSAAMTAAGGIQQGYSLDALIADVERRSTSVVETASERTEAAVSEATKALVAASDRTRASLTDAGQLAHKVLGAAVSDAERRLTEQLGTLLGGDKPELMTRLQPALEAFSRSLQERAVTQTSELIEKVAHQFDPADPTSPMAQHLRTLNEAQAETARTVGSHHQALCDKLDALSTGLAVARATEDALSRSALKGATYEEQVHCVLSEIAAGLGDEYVQTGNVTGLRTRSKKGDGVLTIPSNAAGHGDDVRVVVEMTDSPRSGWAAYLAEAEENRGAQASLGLVRFSDQLAGGPLLTLGPRRIVIAFDPTNDDPRLLRCVVQLLRLAACAAAARMDRGEIETADERMVDALAALKRIATVQRSAGSIRRAADTIETEVATLHTELTRFLHQARAALSGVGAAEHDEVA